MTTAAWLADNSRRLEEAGITTARLDCLVLLEDATGKDRAWLLSHPEFILQGSILKKLSTKIAQRAKHVPLAYIRGKAEFYGREFAINAHTLVPRPETETMIDMLKRVRNMEADVATWQVERRGRKPIKKKYPFEAHEAQSNLVKTDNGYEVVWQKPLRTPRVQKPAPTHGQSLKYHDEDLLLIDIGTGSGTIAITVKLEIPDAIVIATDIDQNCLEMARLNAHKLGASVTFRHGNLLKALKTDKAPEHCITILLCNLPYVPDNFQINTAATHEPHHALFGGLDGLDLYRELFTQAQNNPLRAAYILTESLPPQHETLSEIAQTAGYRLTRTDDFIQLFELAS